MNTLRRLINEHPRVVLTSFVVAAVILIYVLWPDGEQKAIPHIATAYFFDQNTGELLVLPADTDGPVDTESGLYQGEPAGVRAHVFSCGRCTEDERFVGWLEKPTALSPHTTEQEPASESAHIFIRSVDNPTWVLYDSPAGRRMRDRVSERCGDGQKLRYCAPKTMRVE